MLDSQDESLAVLCNKAYSKCKRFVRAYHEVKYNRKESTYFNDFDRYDRSEMVRLIKKVYARYDFDLDGKSDADIKKMFQKLISKEVRDMERDTLGSFS